MKYKIFFRWKSRKSDEWIFACRTNKKTEVDNYLHFARILLFHNDYKVEIVKK